MPKSSKITSTAKASFTTSFNEWRHRVYALRSAYLNRRVHKSFRLSDRRDYKRALVLPGYWRLTGHVSALLFRYKKTFLLLGLLYAVFWIIIVGFGSQANYLSLVDGIRESGIEEVGHFGAGISLFASVAASGLTAALTIDQQIYSVILVLLIWLTTVWLLRQIMAGHSVRLRDGLYSAGAPIVALFLLVIVSLVQLLPLGIAIIAYQAAQISGLLEGGVEAMLFWVSAGLAGLLSLYWVTSTFFAMIVVTLPGTYPWHALRTAGDMVSGRRLRLLLRLLWMSLLVAVTWILVLLPAILLTEWMTSFWSWVQFVPIVPATLLILTTLSLIWSCAYIYMLYRKVIDNDQA